jgi:hypothetical protein
MRGLAAFVMRSRAQAILAATAFALLSLVLPPSSYLTGGVVALVTLRLGWREGLLVLAGTGAATALAVGLAFGNPLPAVAVFGLLWVPVWLLGEALRRTAAQGPVLSAGAVAAAALVLLTYLVLGSPAEWWRSFLDRTLVATLAEQGLVVPPEVVERVSRVMTGVVASASLLGGSLSLLIGRWWQSLLYNPGGFGTEFRVLRVDRRIGVATVALLIALALGEGVVSAVAAELVLVALVIYTLQGLAVAHAFFQARRSGGVWLGGVYATLLLLWPYPLIALGLVGLTDSWADFRSRTAGPGGPPADRHDS